MSYDLFPELPDAARCWVYIADRPLPAETQKTLKRKLESFLAEWTSHGRSVKGHAEVVDDRFLVVAAIVENGDISGCGIDASVHAVEEAAQQIEVSWLSGLHVAYRQPDGRVAVCARSAFREQVRAGAVTAQTPVFDPSVTSLGELRAGAFEKPAAASWHAQVFRIPAPAAS